MYNNRPRTIKFNNSTSPSIVFHFCFITSIENTIVTNDRKNARAHTTVNCHSNSSLHDNILHSSTQTVFTVQEQVFSCRMIPQRAAITQIGVMQMVDVQMIIAVGQLCQHFFLLPSPMLATSDARRQRNQEGEESETCSAGDDVDHRQSELERTVDFLLIETGWTVAEAIAPEGGTDTGVQFGTPIRAGRDRKK